MVGLSVCGYYDSEERNSAVVEFGRLVKRRVGRPAPQALGRKNERDSVQHGQGVVGEEAMEARVFVIPTRYGH